MPRDFYVTALPSNSFQRRIKQVESRKDVKIGKRNLNEEHNCQNNDVKTKVTGVILQKA